MIYERTIDISARVMFDGETEWNNAVVARLHNLALDGSARVSGTMRVRDASDHAKAVTYIVDKVYASDGTDVHVSGADDVQAIAGSFPTGDASLLVRADALSDPELFTPLTISIMIFAHLTEEEPVAYDVDAKLIITVVT
jgi:hypothetical protein